MTMYCGSTIAAPATFEGERGRAWRVVQPPIGERQDATWDAAVDSFIVNVQVVTTRWDYWFVGVAHLRDIDAVDVIEGKTHELAIAVLDPLYPLPDLRTDGPNWPPKSYRIMVAQQFTAKSDAVAQQVLEAAIMNMLSGAMVIIDGAGWRQFVDEMSAFYSGGRVN